MLARGSSGVEVWSVAVDDGSASVGRGEDGARVAEEERDCGGDIEGVVLVVMGESGGRAVVRARLARRVERNARGKGVLLASLCKGRCHWKSACQLRTCVLPRWSVLPSFPRATYTTAPVLQVALSRAQVFISPGCAPQLFHETGHKAQRTSTVAKPREDLPDLLPNPLSKPNALSRLGIRRQPQSQIYYRGVRPQLVITPTALRFLRGRCRGYWSISVVLSRFLEERRGRCSELADHSGGDLGLLPSPMPKDICFARVSPWFTLGFFFLVEDGGLHHVLKALAAESPWHSARPFDLSDKRV